MGLDNVKEGKLLYHFTKFQCIYVPDSETKRYIEELFYNKGIVEQPLFVDVQSKWF